MSHDHDFRDVVATGLAHCNILELAKTTIWQKGTHGNWKKQRRTEIWTKAPKKKGEEPTENDADILGSRRVPQER